MKYDNPAARLLSLLEAGKKHKADQKCREVWGALLNAPVTSKDQSMLMSRLGKAMELPGQTVDAIRESFPDDEDTWRHWSAQVQNAFLSQELTGQWGSFIGHIDDHSLMYLRMSSRLLQTMANTKLIADDDIKASRAKLDEILVEIRDSEQPAEIKKFLMRALQKIITALDEYAITGALPVIDAIEGALGHAVVDEPYRDFLFGGELGGRLREHLSAMADVVTVAIGIPQFSTTLALIASAKLIPT